MGYIFISYGSENQEIADFFKRVLSKNGIQSWMQPGDVPGDHKYIEVYDKVIRNSAGVILLLTDYAQESEWVPRELERAIRYRKPILSVALGSVTVKDDFSSYICNDQGVNIAKPDFDENAPEIQQVLAVMRIFADANAKGETIRKYLVPQTGKMKRDAMVKRGAIGLVLALVLLGAGFFARGLLFPVSENKNIPAVSNKADIDQSAGPTQEWFYRTFTSGRNSEERIPPDLETALFAYQELIKNDYAPAYAAAGRVCIKLGRYSDAEDYLQKAAAVFDDDAYLLLGQLYEDENNPQFNLKQAETYYLQAYGKDKSADAAFALGRIYASPAKDSGLSADLDKAKQYLTEAAQQNHPEAYFRLGLLYDGVDQQMAVNLLCKAYILGYAPAEHRLKELASAEDMERALSLSQIAAKVPEHIIDAPVEPQVDHENADELLEKAAAGDAAAMLEAACLYYSGSTENGIAVDHQRAVEYLLKAGDAIYSHHEAMLILGRYYEGANNVLAADVAKAMEFYKLAAEAGNALAHYYLARGYYQGTFTEGNPDYAQCYMWAENGAALGESYCMNVIGVLYQKGYYPTAEPDHDKALEWYTKAAERGNRAAMSNIATNYLNGTFGSNGPDYQKAAEWSEKAANAGHTSSMMELAVLYLDGVKGDDGEYIFAPNAQEGFRWLNEAEKADSKSTYCLARLGWFYEGRSDAIAADYQKAVAYYEEAAKQDDAYSLFSLGLLYETDHLGEPNPEKAVALHLKAAEQGYIHAVKHLADGYMDGRFENGVPDYAEAAKWYERAAEQGDAYAMAELVKLYLNGMKGENGEILFATDNEKGLHWLLLAQEANQNDSYLLSWLGWFYAGNSSLIDADYPNAVSYYEKAAALNDAYAMFQLALIYETDQLGAPDIPKAIEWYEKAASLGYHPAAEALAQNYSNGTFSNGVPDYEKAFPWLKAAYDGGVRDIFTLSWLGWYYAGNSDFVEADYPQAVRYYEEAAKQKDAYAMFQLGLIYESDQLGAPDFDKAQEWYETAAALEYVPAMVKLAELYRYGTFTDGEENLPMAIHWYQKAAELGDESAQEQLEFLTAEE